MKFRSFMTLHAIILLVFGLPTLVAPRFLWGMYGMEIEGEAIYGFHVLGGLITANMILSWRFRNVSDVTARKAISYQQLWAWLVTFVVFAVAQLAGVFNLLGWGNVVLGALFVLAFGYYAFLYPLHEGAAEPALQA